MFLFVSFDSRSSSIDRSRVTATSCLPLRFVKERPSQLSWRVRQWIKKIAARFGQDLEAELEGFDKTIRRYEMQSGKTIDEEMLLGIVVNGVQDQSIRDHIIRNSNRLNTYKALER